MSDTSALRSLLEKVAAAPTETGPRAGEAIGRYEIIGLLGEGGFGAVYEARDRELDRRVALKLLRAEADDDWFEREARAIARLAHPNIVTLLDRGVHAGQPYLVLELLHGATLAEVLRDGRLAPARAVAIGLGIARALAHAHTAGVIHLDLKPSNVMIGEDDHVTVLDFGLARFVKPGGSIAATMSSVASALRGAGTPAFMAPEQLDGDTDARTDVFAAGILIYAMLTGELPFALEAASVTRVLRPSFELLRAVKAPRPLRAVVERALAPVPADRYADGGELASALRAVRLAPVNRPWAALAIGAAATAAVAGIAAFALTRHGGAPAPTGTWHVAMPVDRIWTDSGIDVVAGQTVVIHATGGLCTKMTELCAGPAGQQRMEADYSLPGFANVGMGTLLGRIDDKTFALGADRTLAAPAGGRLFLGINDGDATNNTGIGFSVTVELKP